MFLLNLLIPMLLLYDSMIRSMSLFLMFVSTTFIFKIRSNNFSLFYIFAFAISSQLLLGLSCDQYLIFGKYCSTVDFIFLVYRINGFICLIS
jgi:hypothetical protein